MQFEDLDQELKDKAAQCKTPEELLELAQSEGIELSDDQLASISGGWGSGGSETFECTAYMLSQRT